MAGAHGCAAAAGTKKRLYDLRYKSSTMIISVALGICTRLATTVGHGPRFLHSTGQLHKGDAGRRLFIQIIADSPKDALILDEG
jgi:hypothetical protein